MILDDTEEPRRMTTAQRMAEFQSPGSDVQIERERLRDEAGKAAARLSSQARAARESVDRSTKHRGGDDAPPRASLPAHVPDRRMVFNDPMRERGLVAPLPLVVPGFIGGGTVPGSFSPQALMKKIADLEDRLAMMEDQDDWRNAGGGADDGDWQIYGPSGYIILPAADSDIPGATVMTAAPAGTKCIEVNLFSGAAQWTASLPVIPQDPTAYRYLAKHLRGIITLPAGR